MFKQRTQLLFVLIINVLFEALFAYSAIEDWKIIKKLQLAKKSELNHAKVARSLVAEANWASVATISSNAGLLGYPMVNIVSIDDRDSYDDESTGRIHFMLADLDFTGIDWKRNNKTSFLFSEEQNLNCRHLSKDPMEPTCARVIISGEIQQINRNDLEYDDALIAFTRRHPASLKWIKAHIFYLCKLHINNIYVLDYYGGPHNVTVDDYYAVKL